MSGYPVELLRSKNRFTFDLYEASNTFPIIWICFNEICTSVGTVEG